MARAETYNDKVVRQFAIMTVVWGIVGMAVGVLIAAQLLWPALNFDIPWLTYSRLRPLHTNAVIFAFGGSALFATSYYIVQRTCHARLFSRSPRRVHVLGLAGRHRARRDHAAARHHAEQGIRRARMADRPADRGRVGRLRHRVLRHDRRSARSSTSTSRTGSSPRTSSRSRCCTSSTTSRFRSRRPSPTSSTPASSTRWCSGGTATTRSGFFLTAGFLGMMYYFVPKQVGRPIYSYRLSIVHFWALISIYMWAGPHHLHYTSLPDWAQSLGMVFSLMLLAPSWGGMINGLMTHVGRVASAAHRSDHEVPRRVAVVLRHVDVRRTDDVDQDGERAFALHRLDHRSRALRRARLGRVHLASRSLYALHTEAVRPAAQMWSVKLMDAHFWIATIGIVLYVTSMWIAGVMQGLMWRALNDDGTLTYTFVESLKATYPYYAIRLLGGLHVPQRHVHHGLQRLAHGARNASPAIGRRPCRIGHDPRMSHEIVEKKVGSAGRADRRGDQHRRPRRDRAAVCAAVGRRAGARRQALRAARARRPRHLRARRLLQLPLADGASAAGGDRALRSLLARRRSGLRPSVPVRLQAHRPGSRARRRSLHGRMASRAPDQSARRRARIEHAGLSVALPEATLDGAAHGAQDAGAASDRRAVHGRRHCTAAAAESTVAPRWTR